jgi:hypothetical protein
MRKFLMGAAAVAAFAVPGIAIADSGTLGVRINNVDAGGGDLDVYGIEGSFNHDFSNGWTVQGDGASHRFDFGGGGNPSTSYFAGAAGMRHDSHALYGFIGNNEITGTSGTVLGIGGQLQHGQAQFNGSVGYVDFDGVTATNVSVDGTYFFTENLGLNGLASYTEFDTGGDPDWTTLGIGGVYRFTGSPFAIDAGYRNVDQGSGDNLDVISLGMTLQLGTDSAQENNRATWNGARRVFEDILWIF